MIKIEQRLKRLQIFWSVVNKLDDQQNKLDYSLHNRFVLLKPANINSPKIYINP